MELLDSELLEERLLTAMGALENGEDPDRVHQRFWNDLCRALDRYVSYKVRQPILMQRLAAQEAEREDCKQYVYLAFRSALAKFLRFHGANPGARFVPWVKLYIKHRIIDFKKKHHGYKPPRPDVDKDEYGGPWLEFVTHGDDHDGGEICDSFDRIELIHDTRKLLTDGVVHLSRSEEQALQAWMHGLITQTPLVRRALRRLRHHYRAPNPASTDPETDRPPGEPGGGVSTRRSG